MVWVIMRQWGVSSERRHSSCYGVSVVRIVEKTDHIITALHCVLFVFQPHYLAVWCCVGYPAGAYMTTRVRQGPPRHRCRLTSVRRQLLCTTFSLMSTTNKMPREIMCFKLFATVAPEQANHRNECWSRHLALSQYKDYLSKYGDSHVIDKTVVRQSYL